MTYHVVGKFWVAPWLVIEIGIQLGWRASSSPSAPARWSVESPLTANLPDWNKLSQKPLAGLLMAEKICFFHRNPWFCHLEIMEFWDQNQDPTISGPRAEPQRQGWGVFLWATEKRSLRRLTKRGKCWAGGLNTWYSHPKGSSWCMLMHLWWI